MFNYKSFGFNKKKKSIEHGVLVSGWNMFDASHVRAKVWKNIYKEEKKSIVCEQSVGVKLN